MQETQINKGTNLHVLIKQKPSNEDELGGFGT